MLEDIEKLLSNTDEVRSKESVIGETLTVLQSCQSKLSPFFDITPKEIQLGRFGPDISADGGLMGHVTSHGYQYNVATDGEGNICFVSIKKIEAGAASISAEKSVSMLDENDYGLFDVIELQILLRYDEIDTDWHLARDISIAINKYYKDKEKQ